VIHADTITPEASRWIHYTMVLVDTIVQSTRADASGVMRFLPSVIEV
jgi:hypothetical protein